MLRSRDAKKKKARIVQSSKEGKVRRSQVKYKQTNDAHKTQLDAYKEGMFYESGVAITLKKKDSESRTPKLERYTKRPVAMRLLPSSLLHDAWP